MSSSLVYILPTYVQGLLPFYVSVVDTTPQQTRPIASILQAIAPIPTHLYTMYFPYPYLDDY